MNINPDRPIEVGDDLLSRKYFAKNISKKINNYKKLDSLSIGLMGEWGSGKSSLLNFIKGMIDKEVYEIVEFNPWLISNRDQLITDFFNVLSTKVFNSKKEKFKELSTNLKQFSNFFKPISNIPIPEIQLISKVLCKFGEMGSEVFDNLAGEQDFMKLKDKIDKNLKEYDKKILVIIDEIDRLENKEVIEIFKLIRAVGDFNNIVYLVAFDKDRIDNILDISNNIDYMDKIINIPIHIPKIPKEILNDKFKDSIENMIKKSVRYNEFKYEKEQDYWNRIYNMIFKDRFNNLREIYRFLNVISFYEDILDNVNLVDFIAIKYIELNDKKLYDWIHKNFNYIISNNINTSNELPNSSLFDEQHLKDLINWLFGKNNAYTKIGKLRSEYYFNEFFSLTYMSFDIINKIVDSNEIEELRVILKEKDNISTFKNYTYEILTRSEYNNYYHYMYLILEFIKTNQFKEKAGFQKYLFDIGKKIFTKICDENKDLDEKIKSLLYDFKISNNINLKYFWDFYAQIIKIIERNNIKGISIENLKEKKSNELKDFILNNYNVEIQRSMYFIKENMRPIYEELFKENKNILYFLEAVKQLAYIGMYNEYDEKGNVVGQFPDEDYCIVKSSVEQYYDLEKLKLMVDKIPKENLSENEKENIKLLKNAVDKNPMDEELEEDYYEDY